MQVLIHDLPNSAVLDEAARERFYAGSVGAKVEAGVEVAESGGWGGVALWYVGFWFCFDSGCSGR